MRGTKGLTSERIGYLSQEQSSFALSLYRSTVLQAERDLDWTEQLCGHGIHDFVDCTIYCSRCGIFKEQSLQSKEDKEEGSL